MSDPTASHPLEDFGALRFQGPETVKFLQGQLSNDMTRLRAGAILRAGLHNAQGRTIALLWLEAQSPDDVLALLPLELVAPVAAHLRRYLLRAKLTISDRSAETRIYGLRARGPASDGSLDQSARYWSFDARRALLIDTGTAPAGPAAPAAGAIASIGDREPLSRAQWRQLDVSSGEPQVYAATSGQFVAQMLNLDCVDAVSFDKGCYTGQEVIARAHFRGRVKRRMQRFETLDPARLAPGDSGQLDDGRSLRVVEAWVRPDGHCEFLAVAPLSAAGADSPPASPQEPRAAASAISLRARNLPLPYPLPE